MMQTKQRNNVILYIASQIVSLFGSSLVQCVIFWHITLTTQSGTMMTIAMIAGFIPQFLVSPFAGVWADRYDRKRIIILADALTALATAALFVLFRLGYDSVWVIFGAMAVRGFGQGLQQPAVGAFLPQIVPRDKLMRINGVYQSAQSAMMLISPALGGVLFKFYSIETTFLIDVATAVAAMLILAVFVKSAKQAYSEIERKGAFSDIKEGIAYIRRHKFAGRFIAYQVPLCVLIAPVAILFSLIITTKFGDNSTLLAINESLFAVGMLGGGALMMTWGGFKKPMRTIILGCALMSLGTIAYGLVPHFWIFGTITVIIGVSMPMFNTPSVTLLQKTVDDDYLGRVMSLFTMISTLGMPLGLLVFGPLADKIGISVVMIATGIAMSVVTVVMRADKTLRKI